MRGTLSSMMFWIGVAVAAWFLIPGLSDRTKSWLSERPAKPEMTLQGCNDICDQNAMMNQSTAAQRESCRRRCAERFRVAPEEGAYDPIHEVTRAPADHNAAPRTGRIERAPVRR